VDPIDEHSSLFEREGGSGARYQPTPFARGPWDPDALHGGPVAALFAHAIEAHEPGDVPPFVARLTVELLRPVPLVPLTVTTATLRPGRKVGWVDAAMTDDHGRTVAVARALRTHRLDPALDVGDAANPPVPRLSPPHAAPPATLGVLNHVGFWSANEFALVAGAWDTPGPAGAWLRLRVALVAGATLSPLERVCAAADFGSGLGNPVRMSNSGAINPEITVHVHRHARGEWIGLESTAWAHGDGAGLCETRLFDEHGPIGRGTQALLVQEFRPFPEPPGS